MKTIDRIAGRAARTSLTWKGDSILSKLFLAYCRNTPEFWGKRRIYQWIASALFDNKLSLRNDRGVRFGVEASDFIGRAIAFEGNYEERSLALATAILEDGGVFVDIGCNIGLYSFTLGSLPGVKVYSIDGSFMALSRFHQNFLRNPDASVEMVNCAMAPDGGLKRFELPVLRNLGTTMLVENPTKGTTSQFWVGSSPLQRILEALRVPRIKLLKIDVEGYELEVFRSLDFKSSFRPENMIVECDPEFPKALECYHYLVANGYTPLTIEGKPITNPADVPEKNVWFRNSSMVAD